MWKLRFFLNIARLFLFLLLALNLREKVSQKNVRVSTVSHAVDRIQLLSRRGAIKRWEIHVHGARFAAIHSYTSRHAKLCPTRIQGAVSCGLHLLFALWSVFVCRVDDRYWEVAIEQSFTGRRSSLPYDINQPHVVLFETVWLHGEPFTKCQ